MVAIIFSSTVFRDSHQTSNNMKFLNSFFAKIKLSIDVERDILQYWFDEINTKILAAN